MSWTGDAVKTVAMSTVLLISLSAPAQVFVDPPRYETSLYPNEVVVADFNKDGNWDVATVDNYYLSVLLGKPDGSFHQHVDYLLGSNFGRSIVAGDFNGDGYPDLAVVSEPSTGLCNPDHGFISIYINKGDGTFPTRQDYQPLGCIMSSIVTGDFNHDGKLDLAIVNGIGPNGDKPGDVETLLGVGDGTFQRGAHYPTSMDPWTLVTGDFNKDGNLDLAVSNLSNQPALSLYLGKGDGTFQQRMDFGKPSDLEDVNIVSADFNNDGNLDLAIGDGNAHIFLGNGDGTFQTQIDIQDAGLLGSLSVADLNGDGIPDLIGGSVGVLAVLLGNGDGTFQVGNDYAWPFLSAAAVDLNHDGKQDLLATGGSLYGYLGTGVIGVFFGKGDGTFPDMNRAFQLPGPSPTAVADFNGDGILDVASTNGVMLGVGDGTFLPASTFLSGNLQFKSVVTGDFDGDGNADLAVATVDDNNLIYSVKVLRGKGDGTFGQETDYSVPNWPSSIIAVDLNGDHKLDLAVADVAGVVAVLLGNGDGTFQSGVNYPTAGPPTVIAAGDFDGDGKLDLMTATPCNPTNCSGGISLLRGNGDGTFQPYQDFDLPGGEALGLAAGDFNRDGRLDFVVTVEDPQSGSLTSQAAIYLGNGDGTFQAPVYYDVGSFGYSIQVQDFNGDGKLDLAIATDNGTVSLLLGNGDGTFQPKQDIVAPCCSASLGDFNADGKLDLSLGGTIVLNTASIPSFTFSLDLTGAGSGTVVVTPGFVCSSQCSHNYAKGANLTLTPKPAAGSVFSGWTGAGCSGTGPCTFTLSTQVSVTADFELAPDFSVSASDLSPATVSPGQSATATITTSGIGGFGSSVSFTCSVSPSPQFAPQCSISPTSVTPGTPATLTVTTTASSAQLISRGNINIRAEASVAVHAAWLLPLGLIMMSSTGQRHRTAKRRPAFLFIFCLTLISVGLISLTACGGSGSNGGGGGGNTGTPHGNYTITIQGVSGSSQHTTTVMLTVQ